MPTSANSPKNPSNVRADVGIRAPILPLSQQPIVSCCPSSCHRTFRSDMSLSLLVVLASLRTTVLSLLQETRREPYKENMPVRSRVTN